MEHTTLIIENISDIDTRLSDYLDEIDGEKKFEFNIGRKTQEELIKIFTDQSLTLLCFDSLFADRQQLIKLIGLLCKLKSQISFKEIRILYGHNDLETFLNQFQREFPEILPYLRELFDHFQIYSIQYGAFEDTGSTNKYFKKITYHYDLIRIHMTHTHIEGETYFFYQQSPIIDPRKYFRKSKLIEFDRDFLKGEDMQDFWSEIDAFLQHQEGIIEIREDEEKEILLLRNQKRQIISEILQIKLS